MWPATRHAAHTPEYQSRHNSLADTNENTKRTTVNPGLDLLDRPQVASKDGATAFPSGRSPPRR
ncbi:unnamed protein product [Clonostachys rosea f. rosea IK726]|uniref:Uncharacterized protein n=1 Tax=Clonostachys rosea f. rosea IK726 TaxID=1349383 RepID=A0ACA9UIU1_BIOOC|nr:unnamed protein product [Clonostachys rosea f. rosea IK726]